MKREKEGSGWRRKWLSARWWEGRWGGVLYSGMVDGNGGTRPGWREEPRGKASWASGVGCSVQKSKIWIWKFPTLISDLCNVTSTDADVWTRRYQWDIWFHSAPRKVIPMMYSPWLGVCSCHTLTDCIGCTFCALLHTLYSTTLFCNVLIYVQKLNPLY